MQVGQANMPPSLSQAARTPQLEPASEGPITSWAKTMERPPTKGMAMPEKSWRTGGISATDVPSLAGGLVPQ